MSPNSEVFLASVEGPNGLGKGWLTDRVMYILDAMSFARYKVDSDTIPFFNAVITEPPDLPILFPSQGGGSGVEGESSNVYSFHEIRSNLDIDYANELNEVLVNGKSANYPSWRKMLKEGDNRELLEKATTGNSRDAMFAEGFLTSRAVLEFYMKNLFKWNQWSDLPPFVRMLPDLAGNVWSNRDYKYSMLPHERILIKDRGTASTAAFQGGDPEVQEMIRGYYERGELQKEDVTFIVTPSNFERWVSTLKARKGDKDVHDTSQRKQLDRYLSLRGTFADVFSKDIIHLENDPGGVDFHINPLSYIIPLVMLASKEQRGLFWFDEGEGINSVNMDTLGAVLMIGKVSRGYIPAIYNDMAFEIFYEREQPRFFYKGIPLLYYSGDVGIVWKGMRYRRSYEDLHLTEIVLAKDMKDNIVVNPKFY